jgi:hypothetical protein
LNRRGFLAALAGSLLGAPATPHAVAQTRWSAGVASLDITPERPLWMGGYAARARPSEGVALPLHAKALALRSGRRLGVLVTADLLGLTAGVTGRVAARAQARHGIDRADILFNASHTHCGPIVERQLSVAYDLSPAQWEAIAEYTPTLEGRLSAVIDRAVSRLRPASVACGRGESRFARNRRLKFSPGGPVDHSVPVLRVDGEQGDPIAIVFGYACHNTTLPATFVQYHGDYAGVAQAALEARHRGAIALFVAGCGADANPDPRGTVELVQAHGTALADAVDGALAGARPVPAALTTAYTTVDLPFADGAEREEWRRQLTIDGVYLERHAAVMAAIARRDGRPPAAQTAPLQVWGLGTSIALVALSGEVVVDYALRLAREYPHLGMWIAGYSNDVFGYVPSLRVLREGGYEGGDAMIYYGRPAPFTEAVEETIVQGVARLVEAVVTR